VTSPDENLVKDHNNNKDAIPFATWYMPQWDENEIEALIALKGDIIRSGFGRDGNLVSKFEISVERR
jgi:hypothetical protein